MIVSRRDERTVESQQLDELGIDHGKMSQREDARALLCTAVVTSCVCALWLVGCKPSWKPSCTQFSFGYWRMNNPVDRHAVYVCVCVCVCVWQREVALVPRRVWRSHPHQIRVTREHPRIEYCFRRVVQSRPAVGVGEAVQSSPQRDVCSREDSVLLSLAQVPGSLWVTPEQAGEKRERVVSASEYYIMYASEG